MAQERLNNAVEKMVDELDRSLLRDLQKSGYLCSAKCFDNKSFSSEQLQGCVQRCQMPMEQLQNYLQQEMQAFQNRLQRCASECQDRARDALPLNGNASESKLASVQKDMESCTNKCVDTHVKLLPALQRRVEEAVDQVKQQQQQQQK